MPSLHCDHQDYGDPLYCEKFPIVERVFNGKFTNNTKEFKLSKCHEPPVGVPLYTKCVTKNS